MKKALTPKELLQCFGKAAVNTVNHDGVEFAGYLAFLGLLSLFPFLVFTVAVIGVFGQGSAGAEFITYVMQTLPDRITDALKPRIIEIVSGPPQGLLTVSILGAIWTASSAVEGLRTVLNRAYHVATPPAYWLRRSLSVLQLLFFTSILIAGMLVLVFIPLLMHDVQNWLNYEFLSSHEIQWGETVFFLTVGVLFAAVSYLYYLIPNIKQHTISVAPGSFVVVMLWLGAAQLFTLYLSNFEQVNLIYGSLGGIIAALIFFYICNLIFIFGAEFNYQIVDTLGIHIVQREKAPKATSPSEPSLTTSSTKTPEKSPRRKG